MTRVFAETLYDIRAVLYVENEVHMTLQSTT